MLMCARAQGGKIKSSARRMMKKASALYLLTEENETAAGAREKFEAWLDASGESVLAGALPVYTRFELPQLIERVRAVDSAIVA
jgi:hypothetical protein